MTGFEAASPVADHWLDVAAASRERLHSILYWDMTSEYDARFLSAYLRAGAWTLSEEFWARERVWAADEERHFRGFQSVYERLFGASGAILERRRPDFAPLAHLFADEFSMALLLAYDELTTVRGYRVNLGFYDQLGPAFGRYVRMVIADEGRHYGSFLGLLRERHAHRFGEAERSLQCILDMEGTPYAQTFVLDHDEEVYTQAVAIESASILLRHLGIRV